MTSRSLTPHWSCLLGLPYRDGARGPAEYDCLGVMAAALGIAIDEQPPDPDRAPWHWIALREALAKPGAAIVTRTEDGKRHVWTVVDRGRVLSALPDRGVCVLPSRIIAHGAESIVGCYVYAEAGP